MTKLTDAKAAELRALCDKATPGPWVSQPQAGVPGHCFSAQVFLAYGGEYSIASVDPTDDDNIASANATFIAAARTAIPALLDEREELIKERDRIARDLKMYRGDVCGTWRCFQCDKVFTNRSDAQRHFGWWPADKPMCVNEHAGGESYWRDRFVELDKIHDDTNRKNFERWKAEKTRADASETALTAALAREKVLSEALSELVELMEGVTAHEYSPDSFTTQPACAALNASKKGTQNTDETLHGGFVDDDLLDRAADANKKERMK